MDNLPLESQIEAILFYKAEPVKINDLVALINETEQAINEAIGRLSASHSKNERGLIVIRHGDEVALGTKPETAELLEKIAREEMSAELGRATLETLALILYESPISRPEIDFVRGVNSGFTLRHLLARGLIERTVDSSDSRRYLYRPTMELWQYLGVTKAEELPDFEEIQSRLIAFKNENTENLDDTNNNSQNHNGEIEEN